MLQTVLSTAGVAFTVFGSGLFGYLRYRRYTKTIEHIVDKYGIEALPVVRSIKPPGIGLTRRSKPAAGELQRGTHDDAAA
jgi:hypothetical protein